MNNAWLYVAITIAILWAVGLWFWWKGLKHYAKLILDLPPRNVLYLIIKKKKH